ncbi:MAG: PCP reductase family protein [Candidatus Dormibacteria bacterium]
MTEQEQGGRCPYPFANQPAAAAAQPGSGCPVPHGPPAGGDQGPAGLVWTEAAEQALRERIEQTTVARDDIDLDRAEAMSHAVVESRAARAGREQVSDLFVRTLGKKLGYGHPLSERSGSLGYTWSAEAEARLAGVPEFCRELTRWRVEWTANKLGLGPVITPEVMQAKYDLWGAVSHRIQERDEDRLEWTASARARFAAVPEFVQGQVLEAIEGNARTLGAEVVDDSVVDRVIERWSETGDFHEGLYGFR